MINRRTLDSWIFSILAVIAVVLAWVDLGGKFPELRQLNFFPERSANSIEFLTAGAVAPPDHSLPLALTVARILGLIVSLWAVGKVIAHVFAEHIQEIRIGLLRRHMVVAG